MMVGLPHYTRLRQERINNIVEDFLDYGNEEIVRLFHFLWDREKAGLVERCARLKEQDISGEIDQLYSYIESALLQGVGEFIRSF